MTPEMDPEIRASDFKKAWPTAMAVALRECGELMHEITKTSDSIQESKAGIYKLAEMIPIFLNAAESRLEASAEKFSVQISLANEAALNSIESERFELERLRKQFIEQYRIETIKLLDTAARLQEQTVQLANEKITFDKERSNFKNLPILKRIFYINKS